MAVLQKQHLSGHAAKGKKLGPPKLKKSWEVIADAGDATYNMLSAKKYRVRVCGLRWVALGWAPCYPLCSVAHVLSPLRMRWLLRRSRRGCTAHRVGGQTRRCPPPGKPRAHRPSTAGRHPMATPVAAQACRRTHRTCCPVSPEAVGPAPRLADAALQGAAALPHRHTAAGARAPPLSSPRTVAGDLGLGVGVAGSGASGARRTVWCWRSAVVLPWGGFVSICRCVGMYHSRDGCDGMASSYDIPLGFRWSPNARAFVCMNGPDETRVLHVLLHFFHAAMLDGCQ